MRPARRVLRVSALAGGLVLILLGYTVARRARQGAAGVPRPLAGFTAHDVRVSIGLECGPGGRAWLAGRFTPARPGFHLYGMGLPRGGVDGIGRPTLLEVVEAPGLSLTGPLRADRSTEILHDSTLDLDFPVYPAGPVTLRAPVSFAAPGVVHAVLSVTYMVCDGRRCMPPTTGRRLSVVLPRCDATIGAAPVAAGRRVPSRI